MSLITSEELLERIEKIESRNKRVEVDKKWEGSWTRKLAIGKLRAWWQSKLTR